MRGFIEKLKKVVLVLVGLMAGAMADSTAYGAALKSTDIPTADVIANIGVVGLAMIGVALAVVGFKFARRMLN